MGIDTSGPVWDQGVLELAPLLRDGELSPCELAAAYLQRIESVDRHVGAFLVLDGTVEDQARSAEEEIRAGSYRGVLHGTCFAIKDQIDSREHPSSMRLSRGDRASRDAAVVTGLREAGAIYLGKVVMSGQPGVRQPRNPWDLDRVTGGSSSGSAAAVAAGLCTFSLGEDSAGSIRFPAAHCGVVGAMASYGRVSRRGVASMGWTLDHVGPITRSVDDALTVLEVIAEADHLSAGSRGREFPTPRSSTPSDIAGLRIGVPYRAVESPAMGVSSEVRAAFDGAVSLLVSLGAQIVDVDPILAEEATFIAFVIYAGEYWAEYGAAWRSLAQPIGAAQRERLALGAVTSAGDYLQAQRLRRVLSDSYRSILATVDVVATPTLGRTAPLASDPAALTRWWTTPGFAAPANLVGMPAVSVPAGFDSGGLPVGLQLMAAPFDEETLFRVASAFEASTPWSVRRPSIDVGREPVTSG